MQRDEDGAQTPSILSFPLGTCAPSENQREFGDGFVKATTGPRRKEAHAALAAVLFFFFFLFPPFFQQNGASNNFRTWCRARELP